MGNVEPHIMGKNLINLLYYKYNIYKNLYKI
jgi:hypothetical protein